ncbi:MAG: hypothetical protein M3N51_08565 [Actinomycetota bacterium]|nr:hypothetical protein [Actinomycetota bacterium]
MELRATRLPGATTTDSRSQLPPDPWGLEPDHSVAPLVPKPKRWRRRAPATEDVDRTQMQGGQMQGGL